MSGIQSAAESDLPQTRRGIGFSGESDSAGRSRPAISVATRDPAGYLEGMVKCSAPTRGHQSGESTYNCPVHGAWMRHSDRQVNAVLKAAPPAPEGAIRVTHDGRSGRSTPNVAYRDEQGLLHNPDGPAEILYTPEGSLSQENWYSHGEPHRDDGPAQTDYDYMGLPGTERWYVDGRAHRIDGPAWVDYDQGGAVMRELWFFRGEEMSDLRRRAPEFGISRDNDAAIDMLDDVPLDELTPEHPSVVLARQLFPNA